MLGLQAGHPWAWYPRGAWDLNSAPHLSMCFSCGVVTPALLTALLRHKGWLSHPISGNEVLRRKRMCDQLWVSPSPRASYQRVGHGGFQVCAGAQNSHGIHGTRDPSRLAQPKPIYSKTKAGPMSAGSHLLSSLPGLLPPPTTDRKTRNSRPPRTALDGPASGRAEVFTSNTHESQRVLSLFICLFV